MRSRPRAAGPAVWDVQRGKQGGRAAQPRSPQRHPSSRSPAQGPPAFQSHGEPILSLTPAFCHPREAPQGWGGVSAVPREKVPEEGPPVSLLGSERPALDGVNVSTPSPVTAVKA